MNIANTERYLNWRQQKEAIFRPEYLKDSPDTILERQLNDHWKLQSRLYHDPSAAYPVDQAEHCLLDAQNTVRYTWRTLDTSAEFFEIIRHANGRDYMIFHRELYGYSVLDLSFMTIMHFIPGPAPYGEADFEESFIWTAPYYSSASNLLAVFGCFWACPYSVMLLDFTDPMQPQENWFDAQDLIDPECEKYDDIDFDAWSENGDLILRVTDSDGIASHLLTITLQELQSFMKRTL